MKSLPVVALALVLGLTSAAMLHAQDAPPDKKPAAKTTAKGPRVTGIFAKLDDLTAEQRTQINKVHKQAIDDIKKIQEKEEADCMELLTADQKAEAEKLKDESGIKKKKGTDATPATPATQPTKDAG